MARARRHDNEFLVDEALVGELLKSQFPKWAHLPLAPVEPSGTDHTIFRLGPAMAVRLPAVGYATVQTAKEAKWLPFLAPQLPLVLPVPLAMGRPGQGYPWDWSVVPWIEGERATPENIEPVLPPPKTWPGSSGASRPVTPLAVLRPGRAQESGDYRSTCG